MEGDNGSRRHHGGLTGGVLFYIFRYLLNVLLPVGILSIFGL